MLRLNGGPPRCLAATLRNYEPAFSQAESAPKPADFTKHCSLCEGPVVFTSGAVASAARCMVSGSCEKTWVELYPEQYEQDTSKAEPTTTIPCGSCNANICIGRSQHPAVRRLISRVIGDECAVDRAGRIFTEMAPTQYAKLDAGDYLMDPENGIPPYDGQRYSDEQPGQ